MGLSRFLNVPDREFGQIGSTLVTECLARFATIYAELDLIRRDARLVGFSGRNPDSPISHDLHCPFFEPSISAHTTRSR